MTDVPKLVADLFRHESARLVARLARQLGARHLELAEDAVQEALGKALRQWPFRGVPDEPAAWLARVARNAAVDALRRQAKGISLLTERLALTEEPAPAPPDEVQDEVLQLLYACCHPALGPENSIALTLKVACGFSTKEIARAFLCNESAIAQRLVRGKRRLSEERVAIAVPPPHELAARSDAVLEVLYALFNEGYAAHAGAELTRPDVVREALRLCRLVAHGTGMPKAHALMALMALQAARLGARTNGAGELLTLAEQDRSSWDRQLIALGFAHFAQAIGGDELSRYHVEAAIAASHARSSDGSATDWALIVQHYELLRRLAPSPVVELNHAIAIGMRDGPQAGLAALQKASDPALARYHLLHATRARLLELTGDRAGAADALRTALALPCTDPERALLAKRLAGLVTDEREDDLDACIAAALRAHGMDASFASTVRGRVLDTRDEWRQCCGSGCDPCVEVIGKIVDAVRARRTRGANGGT